MARAKRGLEYFNIDVQMSDSIYLVEADCGVVGFAVIVKLWQKIYAEGYYIEWGKDHETLFSYRNKLDIDELRRIIDSCFNRGIFSRDKYEKYGVLTSRGIQIRYVDIYTSLRRTYVPMDEKLCLLEEKYLDKITDFKNEVCEISQNKEKKDVFLNSKDEEEVPFLRNNDLDTYNVTAESDSDVDILHDNDAECAIRMVENDTFLPQKKRKEMKGNEKKRKEIESISSGDERSVTQEEKYPDELFRKFWSAYPKKQDKLSAYKAWKKLKVKDDLFQEIMKSLYLQKENNWKDQEVRFIPDASRWLNGERWNDAIIPPKQYGKKKPSNILLSSETTEDAEKRTLYFSNLEE